MLKPEIIEIPVINAYGVVQDDLGLPFPILVLVGFTSEDKLKLGLILDRRN